MSSTLPVVGELPSGDFTVVENCFDPIEGLEAGDPVTLYYAGPGSTSNPIPIGVNTGQGACTADSDRQLTTNGQVVAATDRVLAVAGTAAIPGDLAAGRYIVCADADPVTLWDFFTVPLQSPQ